MFFKNKLLQNFICTFWPLSPCTTSSVNNPLRVRKFSSEIFLISYAESKNFINNSTQCDLSNDEDMTLMHFSTSLLPYGKLVSITLSLVTFLFSHLSMPVMLFFANNRWKKRNTTFVMDEKLHRLFCQLVSLPESIKILVYAAHVM